MLLKNCNIIDFLQMQAKGFCFYTIFTMQTQNGNKTFSFGFKPAVIEFLLRFFEFKASNCYWY